MKAENISGKSSPMRGRDWFFNVEGGRNVWLNPSNVTYVELERNADEVKAMVHFKGEGAAVITLNGPDAQQLINHLENYGFYAETR
jgi:hypothetical protein